MSSGNKVIKFVAGGCAVLFVCGGCVTGVGAFLFAQFMEPERAALGLFSDIRQNNYAQALQRMDGPYQSSHQVESFQQNAAQIPALVGHTDVSFSARNIDDAQATVSGNLTTPQGPVPVSVRLVKLGDHWYITSVEVQGQALR